MMELTERQERILKTIVEEYIRTARPVGSAAVLAAAPLGVSPATIRNEMAALAELGYIQHLHTSGGRVPTNAGYRYYVERLMVTGEMSPVEAMTIRRELSEAADLEDWLKLAATVLARRIHNVGLVAAPRPSLVQLRHLELIELQPSVVLVLVVLRDGTVLQETMSLLEPWSSHDLKHLAERLGNQCQGMDARQVETVADRAVPAERPIVEMVARLLRRGEEREAQVYHAGLGDMIRQPEFMELRHGEPVSAMNERIRQVVEFLDHAAAAARLFAGLPPGDVHVVVGGDAAGHLMHDYSFVLGRYGTGGEGGFLGVIGPTRMAYPRAVTIVRYMTHLMSDLTHTY
ncbi:MAG TPA: heat-inducible transcriptional repressor HrcA [Chloroflexota bacterium]|nr:heat-inducible transcriptional repressor HrcA [Chloroflexota bacterium]